MWDEYPERWGRDCGIDLVFKHKNGKTWAVQSKCYSPEHDISKSEIDSFLCESSDARIDGRLLIASTDGIGRNALQVINRQEKLSQKHIDLLESIGFIWDPMEEEWQNKFNELKAFKLEHSHASPLRTHPSLGSWSNVQRSIYQKGNLSKDRINQLESIGFKWTLN